ncbi:MAG: carboxylate--amine ligase [Candidatus Riflebacteria bacterium GWC2_50_8]|nr:MAG: carboxylate--amine ligase [Candidatus Riflebacteria bacterium GWC2_50_8]
MITVAVSGINAIDNPGPGIGIIKGLKAAEKEIKIAGLAYDAMEPGIYMRHYVDKAFLIPYPSAGEAPFLARLLDIKDRFGMDVVIPAVDAEMPLFINLKKTLEENGIKTFLPGREQFKLRAKTELNMVAEKIGINCPNFFAINNLEELSAALEQLHYPVMVKGVFYKAARAGNYAEAVEKFHQISAEWGFPVIVQTTVSGEEMNVVGVGDGEGGHFGLVAIKKLWITALGKIWTGVTVHNHGMLQAAEAFVREFKWKGAFELECMVNNNDIHLIEINPRFPAWCHFATGVGINLPGRLLKAALGEEPERDSDYPSGKYYIRFTDDFVQDMETFQQVIMQGETNNEI